MVKSCWKTAAVHLHAAVNMPTRTSQRDTGTGRRTRRGRRVSTVIIVIIGNIRDTHDASVYKMKDYFSNIFAFISSHDIYST